MNITDFIILLVISMLCGMETVYAWDSWKGDEIPFYRVWTRKILYPMMGFWLAVCITVYGVWGHSLTPIRYLLLLITYLLLALVDMKRREVPDRMLLCFLAGQLLISASLENVAVWGWRLVTGLLVAVIFLLVSRISRDGLGMGDAKLLGATAMSAGWSYTLTLICCSLVPAFLYSLWLLVFRRKNMKEEFPYVPFLAVGLAVQMVLAFIS